ncbi:MAG: arylsulfatase [Opitutales bacterium]|nr:arylsulfatase [Opitutales bacterium]MBT5813047.1 arylsulfatase [Opitutales bacterium]
MVQRYIWFAGIVPVRGLSIVQILTLVGAILVVSQFSSAQDKLGLQSRPNVVFILTDDQGYGPMGCHGDVNVKTPALDRLYAESVRFTNFHVQPNCAPTRALLLTGKPSLTNGVWATIRGRSLLRRGESTIANMLQDSGYRTALFGKWHLGDNYPFRPQDRGFEEVLVHGGGGVGNIQDYWANNYFNDYYLHNGKWKQFKGYCTDVWFDEAIQFIEENQDDPFFVMISTNAPHLPLVAPQSYMESYRGQRELLAQPGTAEFYAMVANIDDNIGRLRAKLDTLDLKDNTILIFMSDNGSLLQFTTWNAGMAGGKGRMWDGGHRVPFFISWPDGFSGGRDIGVLTSGLDLRPTLEELCGLESSSRSAEEGKSLGPLIRGLTPSWIDRMICLDYQNQQQTPQKNNPHVVMQGNWRWLAENRAGPLTWEEGVDYTLPDPRGELHNLDVDPGQRHDVKAEHPERVREMQASYNRWWRTLNSRDPAAGHEIVIGSDHENPTALTTHDISGEVAWNHDQVLAGFRATGHWEIEVTQNGEYEFALRRYPAEAGDPILGTIPVPAKLRNFHYFDGRYQYATTHEQSVALPVASASLKIGTFESEKALPEKTAASTDYEVNANGEVVAVKFTANLRAGITKLEASFSDVSGNLLTTPYYIKVTRNPVY